MPLSALRQGPATGLAVDGSQSKTDPHMHIAMGLSRALAERAHALAMLARQTAARGPDSLTVIGPLADIARAGGVPCRDAA